VNIHTGGVHPLRANKPRSTLSHFIVFTVFQRLRPHHYLLTGDDTVGAMVRPVFSPMFGAGSGAVIYRPSSGLLTSTVWVGSPVHRNGKDYQSVRTLTPQQRRGLWACHLIRGQHW
jgi:hypothetical protein